MKTQKVYYAPHKETPKMVQYVETTAKGGKKAQAKQVTRSLYVSKDIIGEDPAEWPTTIVATIEAK